MFDIPDIIMRKKFKGRDYTVIINSMNKLQKLFLEDKIKIAQEKEAERLMDDKTSFLDITTISKKTTIKITKPEDIKITDEDLINFSFLDTVLRMKEFKGNFKCAIIQQFIEDSREEVRKKVN
jgi:mevalonate kinase